ncbi:hypothetical protein K474DRAFT_1679959 [Panus rudis PR-1116 ss-1]|nr:hypothetical protein K474DRAFT_1679959 [Panus rudis PR-1116 ss-1]
MSSVITTVVKRDGCVEPFSRNKLHAFLDGLVFALDHHYVDPTRIVTIAAATGSDVISTDSLLYLCAEISGNLVTLHPDYGILGGRIEVSVLNRRVPASFSECVANSLHSDGIISPEFGRVVAADAEVLDGSICHGRDYMVT